jgi:feruloyl esterase
MKYILLLISLLFFINSMAQSELLTESNFGANPGDLNMHYYKPNHSNDTLKRKPLVVALHGCSQSTKSMSQTTGWNKLADENNFMMLYPAQKIRNNMNRCFNWFELDDISKESGELQSIINMINHLIEKKLVDTSQIYVYGLSAGAAMGVALMAVYPNKFQSGAILAGAPYKIATNKLQGLQVMLKVPNKKPKEWGNLVTKEFNTIFPKLIVCHGERDFVVDINSSIELIKQWTYLHQTDAKPDETTTPFISKSVSRSSFTDKTNNEVVVFYKFSSSGHVVPIDPGDKFNQGGEKHLFTKDIDFFSTYYMAKEFGLIKRN